MRAFTTLFTSIIALIGHCQAIEKPLSQTFILTENQWLEAGEGDKMLEATIDPATSHLTLKAPPNTKAPKITEIIAKTYVSGIQTITLETTVKPIQKVTYLTADMADFIESAKHPNQGGIDPSSWGFDCFLAHGQRGTTFDAFAGIHLALQAPFSITEFGKTLTKELNDQKPKADSQTMFASHLNGNLTDIIGIINHLTQHGFKRILLIADNQLVKLMQIEVKQDPDVTPPVASTDPKNNKYKRFIIYVNSDGTIKHAGKQLTAQKLTELMKKFKALHRDAVIHVRGNKETSFKHIRKVIRIGACAGIDNVVFSSCNDTKADIGKEKNVTPEEAKQLVEDTIKPHEQDLKMSLPQAAPNAKPPALLPMFISIAANGTVSINQGKAKEALDTNPAKHDLPNLRDRLKSYSAAAKAGGHQPIVQIWAHKNAKQQRVVDVLNALAKEKISKVTFTDLVDAK